LEVFLSGENYAWNGNIRAVLFDLDGTLRHSHPTFMQAFLDTANSLSIPTSPENSRRANRWLHYYWAQSPELLRDWQTHLESPDLFWANHAHQLLLAMGCSEAESAARGSEIARNMLESFKPDDQVAPDVRLPLERLRRAGYRLGVVSNRRKSYEEQLTALGLLEYFEFCLFAGDLERWKPSPEMFAIALQHLDLPAQAVVYVGDNYYADVVGARGAGIWPVLIDADNLFPEAGCALIARIGDLSALLQEQAVQAGS
jgi:HAD superfamily hydrolase (TIGR01509 family)